MDAIRLVHTPSGASAEVHPRGAHVTSWIPAGGTEALFVSRAAHFEPGTAIRGGVPVVFPQFATFGPLPKHGFARLEPWSPADSPPSRAVLRLRDSAGTREIWPHAFAAELAVELEEARLSIRLSVTNTEVAPYSFTAALHTYLRVADVRRASVVGLQGLTYRDSRHGGETRVEVEAELWIPDEIDRIYLDAPSELRVRDEVGGRTIRILSEGFADAVVWNPGARGAADLLDMEAGEEREMLCVEAAQVAVPVFLGPGETWRGAQVLEVERKPPEGR
jgi:glucose-6-phosphate 1-epimerase